MDNRKFIVEVSTKNLEQFKAAAERAKALGATHMMVGELPRSRWMWEMDLSDPYPNWCMRHTQLFKIVCPPQLRKYLPTEFIDECFKLVKARCDILKGLGMTGALHSNEPFWLPEEVYREHPRWRGARCDHPRRARRTYYSPCIDNPEVLDMYKYAAKELAKETGIDFISFVSNDCGGGLCWSNGTYPGPNGPEACKHRSMSERIVGFLNALTEGAKEAGVDITLNFNANIGFKVSEAGVDEAWREAADNQVINGRNNKGENAFEIIRAESEWIKGIPRVFKMARRIGKAISSEKQVIALPMVSTDFNESWLYLEKHLRQMPDSWKGYMDGVYAIAQEIAGDEAHLLADALYFIHEGELHFSHDGLGLIMYGIVHQRWINRPFVLFPEELTADERDYYRKFQFQALDETHANDLMDMQNIECARGFSASFLLGETAKKATASFGEAIVLLEKLAEKKPELGEKALLLARRLKIYSCLMKTCANASLFQHLVDDIDFDAEPALKCEWPTRNDPRIERFQNITRSEIDNAYELAELLKGYEEKIFQVTDEANEDIFVFGPNLVTQIRKKAEIMLNHELDANRVFERHNI
ncbi:MAG: hypothetical protein ACOX8S_07440 [Christensenellales bacterium]